MSKFGQYLSAHLQAVKLSAYRVAKESKIDSGLLYRILNGERNASEEVIKALAEFSELQLSEDDLYAWLLLDRFSPTAIQKAAQLLS